MSAMTPAERLKAHDLAKRWLALRHREEYAGLVDRAIAVVRAPTRKRGV